MVNPISSKVPTTREEIQKAQLEANARQAEIAKKSEQMPGGGINQLKYRDKTSSMSATQIELRKQYEKSGVIFNDRGDVIYNPADMGAGEIERARAAAGLPPTSKEGGQVSKQYAENVYRYAGNRTVQLKSQGSELDTARTQTIEAIKKTKADIAAVDAFSQTKQGGKGGADLSLQAERRQLAEQEANLTNIETARQKLAQAQRSAQTEKTRAAFALMGGTADTAIQRPPEVKTTVTPQDSRAKAAVNTPGKLFGNPNYITREQQARIDADKPKQEKTLSGADRLAAATKRNELVKKIKSGEATSQDLDAFAQVNTTLGLNPLTGQPNNPSPQVTPQRQRAKIQTGVADKLNANPNYKSNFVGLTEGNQPTAKNFAVSLSEGAPQKPRDYSQAEVDAMTPQQYAIYKAQYDSYNAYISKQNIQAKKENVANLNDYLRGLKSYIDTQKAAGAKTITIQTSTGSKEVPIGQAYLTIQRTKDVKSLSSDAPTSFGMPGHLGNPINWEITKEADNTVKPTEQDILSRGIKKLENYNGIVGPNGPEKPGSPTVLYKEAAAETLTQLGSGVSYLVGGANFVKNTLLSPSTPILNAVQSTKENPYVANTPANQAIGSPIGQIIQGERDPEKIIRQTGKELGESYEKLGPAKFTGSFIGLGIETLINPVKAAKGVKTSFSKIKTIVKGKPKPEFQVAENMRKPQGEPPSNLNEIYQPTQRLKIPKTPQQQAAEADIAMAARSRDLAKQGADYSVIRYNIQTEKIDATLSTVKLGKGKVGLVKGQTEPIVKVKTESDIKALKEEQAKNIESNKRRAELSDILSEDTMRKMTEPEKKPELSIKTETEIQELKEMQRKNIESNKINAMKQGPLTNPEMEELTKNTPKQFSEDYHLLGEGQSRVMRLSEGTISIPNKFQKKTYIEKVVELRNNPQLEERSPLKFYIKKELGFEESEPIDMTGRLEGVSTVETIKLGMGVGRMTEGKLDPILWVKKESSLKVKTESDIKALKEEQAKNIESNKRRAELSDILSEDTMRKMTEPEKKPELSIKTETEIQELKEMQRKNIESNTKRSSQPSLIMKESLQNKPMTKLDVTMGLAEKAGFKSTRIGLGKGKSVIIKSSVAGSGAVLPSPLLGHAVAAETNPGGNQTGTNQTAPPIPDETNPPSQTVTITPIQNQNTSPEISAIVGQSGFVSESNTLSPRQRRSSGRLQMVQIASQNAIVSKTKTVPLTINRTKLDQKQRVRQDQILRQEQVPELIQRQEQIQLLKQKQLLRLKIKEKPRPRIFLDRKKRTKKQIRKDLKPNDFIGNVHQGDILGGYQRSEIITGISRTAKLEKKDFGFTAKQRHAKSFENNSTSPLLTRTKPGIISPEKKRGTFENASRRKFF